MTTPYQRAIWRYRHDELDRAVLAAIRQHISDNGYPPTVRELMRATDNNSSSAIAASLERLHHRGDIGRTPGKARAIYLMEDGS